jgi:glutamate transport system substrate-binding protein
LRTRILAAAAALGLAASLAGCGGSDDSSSGPDVKVKALSSLSGQAKSLSDAGKIKIGVKIDQPGIGFKAPGADAPEGFDIEMGKILAADLGIKADDIEWVETVSANREPYLEKGTVDLVIASYSITDERRQVVGQAGPNNDTGQQLIVRSEDKDKITGPDKLSGVKVCSVEGSTSLQRVEDEYGASPAPFATYSECVEHLKDKSVDAVTTDGAILMGYAAESPDELAVVGDAFSEERYGVGYKKDAAGMCDFINEGLQKAFDDGTWSDAFDATLGKSGVDAPTAPTLDKCA